MPGARSKREDLHKHLDFIQAVVTRMSAASTSTKSWLLPVVTATYGYGMTQNAWSVIALGLGAVLLFMFLDVTTSTGRRRTEPSTTPWRATRAYRCSASTLARWRVAGSVRGRA